MTVGKSDLASAISQKTGATKKQTTEFINTFVETVEGSLARGEKVQLVGFGTFATRERPAREGKAPGTGEKITIPKATVPAFKAGKSLKEKVNGK